MIEDIREYFEYRDGKVFWKKQRQRICKGSEAGWLDNNGYRRIKFNGIAYQAHHIVWFLHHGAFPEFLDHINNNKLDNRIENLREATRSQNKMNTPVYANSTTKVKGLIYRKDRQKYQARLSVDKKRIHLGYFEDKELATLVLEEARTKYHQQFANNK